MFLAVLYSKPQRTALRNQMRYALIDIYDGNKKEVTHWDGSAESRCGIES